MFVPPQSRSVAQFLKPLQPGTPLVHKRLTLIPLAGDGQHPLNYVLAADAIAAGTLTVSEIHESGSIPELLVISTTNTMILLLDGEELIGAKQDRILNTTILLPPRVKTRIPVSCVEQGRWRHESQNFQLGGHTPSRLRAANSRTVSRNLRQEGLARSDQGEVWDLVAQQMAAVGAASPTGALHDAIVQRQDAIGEYVAALPYPAGARGVVVVLDGQFAALDLLDQPATLERVWPRLVASYALDALALPEDGGPAAGSEQPGPPADGLTPDSAAALLASLSFVPCTACPTVGVGEDWRFEAEETIGLALVADKKPKMFANYPVAIEPRYRTEEPNAPTRAARRNLGKLRKGLRTPEAAYYHPILMVLERMGGAGKVADVLEKVKHIMKPVLKDVDYQPLASGPDNPRWRNAAQWARNSMIKEGLLKADSPRGVWEITDAGRQAIVGAEKTR